MYYYKQVIATMAKVLLNVRIRPEIREQLQMIAEEQNRTFSNLVETVLLAFVVKAKAKPPE